ncbi:MAG: uncharacterized protein HW388_534 [Dehalococcoidia bacterium]|nr:uncharacterized protein [Dehalococcoidia bacterium]
MVMELGVGDIVTLRKVHPCGSYLWEVYRLGADIGLRCTVCGRRLLMERRLLEKRVKEVSPSRQGSPCTHTPQRHS